MLYHVIQTVLRDNTKVLMNTRDKYEAMAVAVNWFSQLITRELILNVSQWYRILKFLKDIDLEDEERESINIEMSYQDHKK